MNERLKYGYSCVRKFENFEQNVAAGEFPTMLIEVIRDQRWELTLKIQEDNKIYPYISCRWKRKHKIRVFFNIKSKYSKLCRKSEQNIYLEWNAGLSGPSISIQDILDPKNGYLINGALSIEYGFQIYAFRDSAANWRFDFETKMFDCWRKEEHIYVRSSLYKITIIFYCPKELLLFHSSSKEFKHLYLPFIDDHLDICLQIAHGVRIRGTQRAPIQGATWLEYAKIGREMGMMNIVHYCDQMYARNYPRIIDKNDLKKAIKLNMRQSVPHIMRLWNMEELLEELREDLDELPGEMMKMLVAKIFEKNA
ncbi:unnamed protein product [Caenorhabditis brenneri]